MPSPVSRCPRWAAAALVLAVGGLGAQACYDSDDKFPADHGIAEQPKGPEWPDDPLDDEGPEWPDRDIDGDRTCREFVNCVVACASDPALWQNPEPDLSCFLACDDEISLEEALLFLDLTECVGNRCVQQGVCDEDGIKGTDNSGLPIDPSSPCGTCLIGGLLDPQPPGCQAIAAQCT